MTITERRPTSSSYFDGRYAANNPTWDSDDSVWKAAQVDAIWRKNALNPGTVCDIGCGAGRVLAELQRLRPSASYQGFDISPQAIELSRPLENDSLQFSLATLPSHEKRYEMVLLLDVIEHVEDYFELVRQVRARASAITLHIPLELTAHTAIRGYPLIESRRRVGHLHFFTKDVALKALEDAGCNIIDASYTAAHELATPRSTAARVVRHLRSNMFRIAPDLTVRAIGGYSLVVLAQ